MRTRPASTTPRANAWRFRSARNRSPTEGGTGCAQAAVRRLRRGPDHCWVRQIHDKLGNWDRYLSDDVAEKLPVERHTFMQGVGLIEIAAGMLVAAKPKWGGYVVGAWLVGIVANLWTKPEYRVIALRDIGLALGAVA